MVSRIYEKVASRLELERRKIFFNLTLGNVNFARPRRCDFLSEADLQKEKQNAFYVSVLGIVVSYRSRQKLKVNCSIRYLYHCRKPRKESDVTFLISALDTTLKMPDVSVDRESPDGETPLENYEEMAPLDVPYGGERTYAYLVPQKQLQHLYLLITNIFTVTVYLNSGRVVQTR